MNTTNQYLIAPSILSADGARLGEEVDQVLDAGADWIHFDVMDNHLVPNLTMGPMFCEALHQHGIKAPLDVHLMIKPVDAIVPSFVKAGATYITFHPEATKDIHQTIKLIKKQDCKVGLALNPETPIDYLHNVIDKLDLILLMSVHPGFGGQEFIDIFDKIKAVRKRINEKNPAIYLAVDGGINESNIGKVAQAGANVLVAGSAIFKTKDYSKTIQTFREKITQAIS